MGVRAIVKGIAVSGVLALCIFAAPAMAKADCPGDAVAPTVLTKDAAAQALLCDINALRATRHLAPLRWDARLAQGADWMANDMANRHYFAHNTPDGRTLPDRMRPTGYIRDEFTWVLRENIGWGSGVQSTPLSLSRGWMASQDHRLNLMASDITDIGIGIAQGVVAGYGSGFYYVADFGSRGKYLPPVLRLRAHKDRVSRMKRR